MNTFNFAGFVWPRPVADMAVGFPALKRKRAGRKICGGYFHAPRPNADGKGFYMGDAGQPFARWKWADDIVSLRHTGWFCDRYGDQTIRGFVAQLPHGRFLAGWSMGEGMLADVGGTVYTSERDAAYAADSMAEHAAEIERDSQLDEEE